MLSKELEMKFWKPKEVFSKLIDNPRLRDLIINVRDSAPEKKTVKKNKVKFMKPIKTKEMDGLELLSAALDLLKWKEKSW